MNSTNINVLDHLAVVHLDTHIWTAKVKLKPVDLGGANLPPEELASLGSKRICNPEDLKTFGTLKARAVTLLERHGIRFLNGWAIPEDKIDGVNNDLDAIRQDFNKARERFLQGYEQAVQDWIAKHPQWAGIIANSLVSESYVRSRLDFKWQVFRILPPKDTNGEAKDTLQRDIACLGETLFDEIAKSASDTWKNCYFGKREVTRKALSPLKSLYDKLMGLTFVEPHVAPVAELIKTSFTYIPRRGPISGGVLLILQGLVSLLRNPQELLEHAQSILEGKQRTQDMLEGFINDSPFSGGVDIPTFEQQEHADGESQADNAPEPVFTVPLIESQGLW
jgi:hypothetical protein